MLGQVWIQIQQINYYSGLMIITNHVLIPLLILQLLIISLTCQCMHLYNCPSYINGSMIIKATVSVHKLIPKKLKWLPYILIGHCVSLSQWFTLLDKNNFVEVSQHYFTSGLIGIYLVKCKQSSSHKSLTTLYSHFRLSYSNQGHDKICPLVVMVIWFAWVIWGRFFSRKYSRRPHSFCLLFCFSILFRRE